MGMIVLFFICLYVTNFRLFKALELLAEKSISSANQTLSPGEALRRVLECLSSGILLPSMKIIVCQDRFYYYFFVNYHIRWTWFIWSMRKECNRCGRELKMPTTWRDNLKCSSNRLKINFEQNNFVIFVVFPTRWLFVYSHSSKYIKYWELIWL